MESVTLKSGVKVEYKEGYLTPGGIEIIVPADLPRSYRREFQDLVLCERDVAKFLYGETYSLFELCFY